MFVDVMIVGVHLNLQFFKGILDLLWEEHDAVILLPQVLQKSVVLVGR